RVYVRGAGAVTPLGRTWRESADRLAAGESAIAKVATFDVEGFPSTVAAAVPESFAGEDRRSALAEIAAGEAWGAGIEAAPERLGVFVGAESGRATLGTVLALSRAAGGARVFDHARFGREARALAARIDASTVSP